MSSRLPKCSMFVIYAFILFCIGTLAYKNIFSFTSIRTPLIQFTAYDGAQYDHVMLFR